MDDDIDISVSLEEFEANFAKGLDLLFELGPAGLALQDTL